jgi:zinc and cadmium transporter
MKSSLVTVLSIALIGDIAVFLASTVLLTHRKIINFLAEYATPFAAGALLSAAFLDFLHDGVEQYEPLTILISALGGLLFFFLLEGWLHWFHHHGHEAFENNKTHQESNKPISTMAIGGNLLHNFIDGAAIAGAFLIGHSAGVITTVAVALHEIPREIADSGYLLKLGVERAKVIAVHGVAIVITAVGTVLFYLTAQRGSNLLAILLGSTAGFFIYIAASDIIPSVNKHRNVHRLIDLQVALVILGAVLIGAAILLAHRFIPG